MDWGRVSSRTSTVRWCPCSKCSHIAVPALDGLADHRCRDLIGDLDIPYFAFALRGEVGEQLRDDRHIAYIVAAQAKAACDVFERGPAEHRQAVVEAVGAQLVKLRAISAVVHRADQDAKSLTLERLELLNMEQEPAIAFEQHDLALVALPARSRNPKRIRQAVADRPEFTDRRVALRRPAAHLGVEIGLMAAADDDVPILWNDRIEGSDHLTWIQHPGFDVEWHRVRGLGRDAMRELLRAYGRRRRFADAQRLVEAGKDCLDADEGIRSDVDVGGLLPVAQAAWGIVQLDLAGFSPEVPATDVVGQACADREHDVRGLVHLPPQRREVAAGDAEPERVIVEKTA